LYQQEWKGQGTSVAPSLRKENGEGKLTKATPLHVAIMLLEIAIELAVLQVVEEKNPPIDVEREH